MARKVIIDADLAVGSALAVLTALKDPEVDLLAITATGGRVSATQSARNVQVIVDFLDPARRPRIGWGNENPDPSSAMANALQSEACSALLNGPTGLGEFNFDAPQPHHRLDSAKLLIEMVREHPNQITLVCLGPLTNVARAAELHPGVLQQFHEIVILGGTRHVSGDITPAAEFNMFADPRSAHAVLSAPATKTLVPLDVSNDVFLSFEQYSEWFSHMSCEAGQIMHGLIPFSLRAHHQQLGCECLPLRELAALAIATRPAIAESRQFAVKVESRGEYTRGATIFDERERPAWPTNIELVMQFDQQAVLDYFQSVVCAEMQ